MAKTETIQKPISKVRIRIHTDGKSTIYRNEGLPSIDDKTDNAIQWLFDKGFKSEEVEIFGQKPENWNSIFGIKSPVEQVVVEPVVIVEPVVELVVELPVKQVVVEPVALTTDVKSLVDPEKE